MISVRKIIFYFQLPEATSILGLALPHFMLGLGIGIIDSALMPLLATLVDEEEHGKAYGSVYAIGGRSQTTLTNFCPLLPTYSSRDFFTEIRGNLHTVDIFSHTVYIIRNKS